MAQIGSPPAGWYTDPSGQHRARFWDGTAWTEQVRDDLGDGGIAPSGAVAGAAPGAASDTAVDVTFTPADDLAPNGGPNPAAATVVGVAEAVAAVAAGDLHTIPTDPGAPGVLDPFAAVGDPATDPFGGAGIVDAGFDPVVGGPLGAAFEPGVASPVEPQIAPPVEASGPPAGWYPDPAARHQARWWDGGRWTERVADHGVEAADPLPGTAGAGMVAHTTADTATGVTAASGASPSPEVGTGDPFAAGGVGTTQPAADASAMAGFAAAASPTAATASAPDGSGATIADGGGDGTVADGGAAPMSAGQASLATLPEADEPVETERARPRPTVKVRVAGGMVALGGLALLGGSATTWMEVRGPRVGDEWTATGLDLGDGRITIALGVVLAILGLALALGRMARFGGTKVAAMGALVAGAAALAVTAVDIADVADRASRLGVPAGAVTDVGTGLWVAFVGALVAVGGGLMAFANRQER